MFSNHPFFGAFGLDIGDSSLKLVCLKKSWHPRHKTYYDIRDIRQTPLPPGCIVFGEIVKPDIVKAKLVELLQAQKNIPAIKSKWVVSSLPVAKTFLKLITISSPSTAVTSQMVYAEAAKHLPLDINDLHLDWQIINNTDAPPDTTPILIGAAAKKIVESYTTLLMDVGLSPLAIEIEDLSIARTLITASKDYTGEARAILDLGGSRSSLIIYDKGSIQFSSLINICGDFIDKHIAASLDIDLALASKLKDKHGISYVDAYPEYLKTITEIMDKLVENIYQIMMFYRDHFYKPNPITHITLSGGLSSMVNVDKFLTEKLKTETAPGNVWKNLYSNGERKNLEIGLAFSSAIGLAIRAASWPTTDKKI